MSPPIVTEIDASELWLRLAQLPRPSRTVDYPKLDPITGEPMGKVLVQILTQEEQMEAAIAAERYTKAQVKDSDRGSLGYENVYKNACSVEVLYRAIKRVDKPTHTFFPSPRDIRQKMTPDEVGVLMAMYLEVQREMGPIVADMTDTELEAWITRLVEGGSAFPLGSLSSEGMSSLVMLMASRLYRLRTDSSSVGSPPEKLFSEDEDPEA